MKPKLLDYKFFLKNKGNKKLIGSYISINFFESKVFRAYTTYEFIKFIKKINKTCVISKNNPKLIQI